MSIIYKRGSWNNFKIVNAILGRERERERESGISHNYGRSGRNLVKSTRAPPWIRVSPRLTFRRDFPTIKLVP